MVYDGPMTNMRNGECSWPECGRDAFSRGLCGKHYQFASRNGDLETYPTTKFLENPEAHINWAFGYDPDLIGDIAIQYGYKLVKLDE